jgi:hypothetical protein
VDSRPLGKRIITSIEVGADLAEAIHDLAEKVLAVSGEGLDSGERLAVKKLVSSRYAAL